MHATQDKSRVTWRVTRSVLNRSLISFLLAVCIFSSAVQAQRIQVQVQRGGAQFNRFSNQSSGTLLIPGPPRELGRAIRKAERSLDDKQYSDAIESLQEILDSPEFQDYFLPHEKNQPWDSVRRKAQRIIGSLPAAGREAYELKVGSDAKQLLMAGLKNNDIASIMEVSRRFFHTTNGYDATMLLARYELDHGRPMSATSYLQRLSEAPAAKSKFGTELPLMLAICRQLSGDEQGVKDVVVANQQQLVGASVTIGGKSEILPPELLQLFAWVKQVAGESVTLQVGDRAEWHLFRGGPTRNGRSDGDLPMRDAEWDLPVALWASDDKFLNDTHARLIDDARAAIPTSQPIVVGDQLLMRTARLMFGVNLETGKRMWPYPEDKYEQLAPKNNTTRSEQKRSIPVNGLREIPRHDQLQRRIWQDGQYSQMSSDGKRLFMLIEPDVKSRQPQLDARRGFQMMTDSSNSYNQLVALDVASEGYTLWIAGGPESFDEQLAEVFFLGCPLPLGDELFAIGELKDEISLICIDSTNGHLKWTQQLAQIESSVPIANNLPRRMSGATPSFSDGILVCPTSAGAIVAVDVASRTLLWAHTYNDPNPSINPFGNRRSFPGYQVPASTLGEHWADSTAIISSGHVLFTSSESNKLICLDLMTGEVKWTPKDRGKMLYVAGIHKDTILVVQESGLRGIKLSDGNPAWDSVPLKKREVPTGRGFVNEPFYIFPTSHSEVVKFDIEAGKIDGRRETDRVLGNLICYGDYMISQGADGLFAYPIEARRRAAFAKLDDDPGDDPDLLCEYARLLVEDGKTDKAIAMMQRAVDLSTHPNDKSDYQQILARMMVTAVTRDFSQCQKLSGRFQSLSPSAELRQQFARATIKGLTETGETGKAMDGFLTLVEATIDQQETDTESKPRSINDESQWKVAANVELAMQLNELLGASNGKLSAAIEKIQSHIDGFQANNNLPAQRIWAQILQHASAVEENDELRQLSAQVLFALSKVVANEQPLESLAMLKRLENSTDEETSFRATIEAAMATSDQGLHRLAADQFRALAETFEPGEKDNDEKSSIDSTEPFKLDGRSAADFETEYLASLAEQNIDLTPFAFPSGAVKITPSTVQSHGQPVSQRWQKMPLRAATSETFEQAKVFVDLAGRQLIIRDRFGSIERKISLGQVSNLANRLTHHAKEFNQVIVVSLGTEIVAIDLFSKDKPDTDRILWRVALNNQTRRRKQIGSDAFFASRPLSQSPSLGAVTANGVCILRKGDLECRDLLTGEVRWMHRGVGEDGAIVFGDEQYACVARTRTTEVKIFDMRDGRAFKSIRMAPWLKRIDTFGRYVIHYEGQYNNGTDLVLKATDPITEKDVWQFEAEGKSRAYYVNCNELALAQPSGNVKIIRLSDGEVALETDVLPEKKLSKLLVTKSRDQYTIVVGRDSQRTTNATKNGIETRIKLQPTTYGIGMGVVTGNIYAVDRKTGRMMWQDPVPVEQFDIFTQDAEVPFVLFLRNMTVTTRDRRNANLQPNRQPKPQIRTRSKNRSSIAVLDTRTGELLMHEPKIPQQVKLIEAVTDVENSKITMAFSAKKIYTLTMTDDERDDPPAKVPALGPAVFDD